MVNEETRVQLQSPGTLQKVMDEFLSFAGSSSGLPAEVEEAESQVAIVRARLGQSQDDQTGSGQYGVIDMKPEEAQAVLFAIKTMGTQQDTSNLSPDISRLKMVREGISGRGSEPTAKGAEGWEVQNQGVTRRAPGEGPGVNGGRTQSQEMDSYDQPQYEAYDWRRDHDSFDVQDTRTGSQEGGPVAEAKVLIAPSTYGANFRQITKFMPDQQSPLMWKLRQVAFNPALVDIDDSEKGDFEEMLHRYLDRFGRTHEAEVELALDLMHQLQGTKRAQLPRTPFIQDGKDKGADLEYSEHGKTLKSVGLSAKQAKKASSGIAADHRKEDPNYYKNEVTLREFFMIEEK